MDVRDLVDRAARGEPKAWDALVDQFGRLVEGIIRKFTNLDDGDRRDVFQDALLGLFQHGLARFRGSTVPEFRAYLAATARNAALSHLRKRKRRPDTSDPIICREDDQDDAGNRVAERADPSPGPEDLASRQETLERLRSCLGELPSPDHEVVWMRARNFSYDEIGQALKLPLPTAGTKFHRAKEKLRDCLGRYGISVDAVFS